MTDHPSEEEEEEETRWAWLAPGTRGYANRVFVTGPHPTSRLRERGKKYTVRSWSAAAEVAEWNIH